MVGRVGVGTVVVGRVVAGTVVVVGVVHMGVGLMVVFRTPVVGDNHHLPVMVDKSFC